MSMKFYNGVMYSCLKGMYIIKINVEYNRKNLVGFLNR